ncbi:hypothetical protein Q3G72_015798 [Acer saccharum]|nr:hypothetical protein Q3G72_015798 [Acer saccharum]
MTVVKAALELRCQDHSAVQLINDRSGFQSGSDSDLKRLNASTNHREPKLVWRGAIGVCDWARTAAAPSVNSFSVLSPRSTSFFVVQSRSLLLFVLLTRTYFNVR